MGVFLKTFLLAGILCELSVKGGGYQPYPQQPYSPQPYAPQPSTPPSGLAEVLTGFAEVAGTFGTQVPPQAPVPPVAAAPQFPVAPVPYGQLVNTQVPPQAPVPPVAAAPQFPVAPVPYGQLVNVYSPQSPYPYTGLSSGSAYPNTAYNAPFGQTPQTVYGQPYNTQGPAYQTSAGYVPYQSGMSGANFGQNISPYGQNDLDDYGDEGYPDSLPNPYSYTPQPNLGPYPYGR